MNAITKSQTKIVSEQGLCSSKLRALVSLQTRVPCWTHEGSKVISLLFLSPAPNTVLCLHSTCSWRFGAWIYVVMRLICEGDEFLWLTTGMGQPPWSGFQTTTESYQGVTLAAEVPKLHSGKQQGPLFLFLMLISSFPPQVTGMRPGNDLYFSLPDLI